MTDDRIAALDENLLLNAEHWMRAAAREWAIARGLQSEHEERHRMGNLLKSDKAGDALRERIRDAERHAKAAEDQAVSLRKQIVPQNRRGPGRREPLESQPKPLDATTVAMLARRKEKAEEKEKRRAERATERAAEAETEEGGL